MKVGKIFTFFFLFFPLFAFAQPINIVVSPTVIDEKLLPRDIRDYQVFLENKGDKLVFIYPIVFEILPEGKREFFEPDLFDKTSSLGSWLRIQRAVIELWPNQEKIIPLSLEIWPQAKVGIYHAVIVFSFGSSLPEAKSNALLYNLPEILLNVEIKENIVENVQLKNFQTEKNLYFSKPVKFILELKNVGNSNSKVKGEILLYNKKGKEIDSIPLEFEIEQGKEKKIESQWYPKNSGQMKAKIFLEYGAQKKEIQDTIFFIFLPWKFLVFLVSGMVVLILILLKLINKKTWQNFSEKIIRPVINLKK